jgi:hypothetical protein
MHVRLLLDPVPSDPPRHLHVRRLDGDSLGMDSEQLGVFELDGKRHVNNRHLLGQRGRPRQLPEDTVEHFPGIEGRF